MKKPVKKAAGGGAGSKTPAYSGDLVDQHKRMAAGHKVTGQALKKGGKCK
jgi:hypothetical protein